MMDEITEGTVTMITMHSRRLCLAVVACVGLLTSLQSARAGSITPWSGASASVQVLDQSQSDTGAIAAAQSSSTLAVSYHNTMINTDKVFQANVQGTASAQATGQANSLLSLNAEYQTPNPGSNPGWFQEPTVSNSASWTGDSIQLHAPDGVNLPGEIRLNFGLTFQVYDSWGWQGLRNGDPQVSLTYNDTHVDLNTYHPFGLDKDSSTAAYSWAYDISDRSNFVTAAFHLDLPIDSKGVSLPFSLALSSRVDDGLASNAPITSFVKDLNLSLDSITLPDGTSVTDAGYGVSFASGMSWPQPHAVPEPASVAVWAGLMTAGVWAVRRRGIREQAA